MTDACKSHTITMDFKINLNEINIPRCDVPFRVCMWTGGVNSVGWTSLTRVGRKLVKLIFDFLAHNISSVSVYGGKNARVNNRDECECNKKVQ